MDKRILINRARIIRLIRSFFDNRNFVEVDTPNLVESPGMEPNLHAFKTVFHDQNKQKNITLYLPTSPEFHMKRLLSAGYEKIYQLTSAFRNGENSLLHNPEFTILEWYRSNDKYESIMKDTEDLISSVSNEYSGSNIINYAGKTIDLTPPWNRMTVKTAWKKYAQIDLDASVSSETLRSAGQSAGVLNLQPDDSWDVLYFKIFLDKIESELGSKHPVILYEYPASMSALARIKPTDPSVALRFEVYIAGIELANAFDELTDPVEQRQRMMDSRQQKTNAGDEPFPVDEKFLSALESGIPPSAGIALGVDRMIMLLLDAKGVKDVIAFPFDV